MQTLLRVRICLYLRRCACSASSTSCSEDARVGLAARALHRQSSSPPRYGLHEETGLAPLGGIPYPFPGAVGAPVLSHPARPSLVTITEKEVVMPRCKNVMPHLGGVSILLACCCVSAARPDTYVVLPDGSGDFVTIQEALDAAVNGDVVELAPGVFAGPGNRDLTYNGKAVTVRSQMGSPETCIIDCEEMSRGFYFLSAESPASVLQGVTIRNGVTPYNGGGILCSASSPRIEDCIISNCTAGYAGGGASCEYGSQAEFIDCLFEENVADHDFGAGGAVYCSNESILRVEDCTFLNNTAETIGGGIHVHLYAAAVIRECTFHGNSGPRGSQVSVRHHAFADLHNCIMAFGFIGAAVRCEENGQAALYCCDVYGNEGGDWEDCISGQEGISGNISLDPLFCGADNGDLTIDAASPCAPFSPPNPNCDLIGAWPIGCSSPTAIEEITWGALKAMSR
ncbi:MAG: hypothetical protein GF355_05480 [Candidatus Eisenbacteria bacterium]|nr:hypothetical protein [Candidatus Eisenbacteria bacterium]